VPGIQHLAVNLEKEIIHNKITGHYIASKDKKGKLRRKNQGEKK
jgi:hypothetical protein